MSANCSSRTGAPPRVATISRPNSRGSSMRPRTLTSVSLRAVSMLPAGSSWFSRASVASTWSMPMPSARIAPGFSSILISRLTAADQPRLADAAHRLEALDDDLVGQASSARAGCGSAELIADRHDRLVVGPEAR